MPWRSGLYGCLTEQAAGILRALGEDEAALLEEMRFRTGRPVEMVIMGKKQDRPVCLNQGEMDELLAALSGYSLYAYETQMAMGFIPLPNGHRAGICGKMIEENGRPVRMSEISSICIRIARGVPGASQPIRSELMRPDGTVRRVLFVGGPGCGKTTILRDAALYLSDEAGAHVAVADEREELFSGVGVDKGRRIDVLRGAQKAQAVTALLRSMSPEVIVTDEIGRKEDVYALLEAARCGVGVLASAHADGMKGILLRPTLRELYDARAFERYIHLGWHVESFSVYDEEGRLCGRKGEENGQLGSGDDGTHWRQRTRLCDGGW